MLISTEVEGWLTSVQQMGLTDPPYLHGTAMLEHILAALMPKETALLLNFPNPFNAETGIPYHLVNATDCVWTICYPDGRCESYK